MQDVHVAVSLFGQRRCRFFGELPDPFDAIDVGGDLSEDGRRVSGTGADFEHPFPAFEQQRLGHERNDVRLRNCLLLGDRQGGVLVGKFLQIMREKCLARHLAHGVEDKLRSNPAGINMIVHHLLPEFGEIDRYFFPRKSHFFSLVLLGPNALTKVNCQ